MTSTDTTTVKKVAQRRSQRLLLRVLVTAQRKKLGKDLPAEPTETLAVNAHGALILLAPPVEENEVLTLKNTKTGESEICRAVYVGSPEGGRLQVGVEFTSPSPQFWRITFPPEDWGSYGKDARPATSPATAPSPAPAPGHRT
jgi:hypothetical protein